MEAQKKINLGTPYKDGLYVVNLWDLNKKLGDFLKRADTLTVFNEYVLCSNFTVSRSRLTSGGLFNPDPPFVFARGDRLDISHNFTGAEALKMNGVDINDKVVFTKDQYDVLVVLVEAKYNDSKKYIDWYDSIMSDSLH
jgi:hypothetical protein